MIMIFLTIYAICVVASLITTFKESHDNTEYTYGGLCLDTLLSFVPILNIAGIVICFSSFWNKKPFWNKFHKNDTK
jgi:hypothetical protein